WVEGVGRRCHTGRVGDTDSAQSAQHAVEIFSASIFRYGKRFGDAASGGNVSGGSRVPGRSGDGGRLGLDVWRGLRRRQETRRSGAPAEARPKLSFLYGRGVCVFGTVVEGTG